MDLRTIAFRKLIFARINFCEIYICKLTAIKNQFFCGFYIYNVQKKISGVIWKEGLLRIFRIQILEKLFLIDFNSCFGFKDLVKVDWSLACHSGTSVLSTLILKPHLCELESCSIMWNLF